MLETELNQEKIKTKTIENVQIIFWTGPPETWKTSSIIKIFEGMGIYFKSDGLAGKNFEGYSG